MSLKIKNSIFWTNSATYKTNVKEQNCSFQSKLITLLISNKKEFNHFFKSTSSDIVLLKLGNLHQNAKRYQNE